MSLNNTRQPYGWAAIALSAAGVTARPGARMEEAPDRVANIAAQALHASVGARLFIFLAARLHWSASQSRPAALERRRPFRIAFATGCA